ncbi:MAG: 3-oxoadipate enol-lactonase, partial [Desulfobacterales bacterium]
GVRINVALSGNTSGPVVLMSHSLATSLDLWSPQLAVLEPRFRVLRYDTRGHGASDAPQGAYTLAQLADDAVAVMDAFDIEAVHWVGISMGGMIGQAVALNHAERLRSLVLCDTAAAVPPEAQALWQQRIDKARGEGMTALADETLQRWFTPPYLAKDPRGVRSIRGMILSTPVSGFIGCSEAIRQLDFLERLDDIRLPTLIIVGEQDPGTPVAISEAIHNRIKDSRLEIIPSAAHLCNVEQAEVFNQILLGFLQTL